jgi:hypothetical protein
VGLTDPTSTDVHSSKASPTGNKKRNFLHSIKAAQTNITIRSYILKL